MIPWSELDGGVVERLVASLVALDHPRANQITPSRGDRGIDILDRREDGSFVVYQVKRYTGSLDSRQAREVEASLDTMLARVASERHVAEWHLVMPWNPSPERLLWLEGLAKKIDPIELRWDDKARLDAWAAEHPGLLDYLLPGRVPRDELLFEALRAKLPDASQVEGAELLGVATAHSLMIQRALDRVDPYYRYEVQHHAGTHARQSASNLEVDRPGLVLVETVATNPGEFRTISIFAKTAMSEALSPIAFNATFAVGPDHRDEFESFLNYGTPLAEVPATIVRVSGPDTLSSPDGTYHVSLTPRPEEPDLPDTELAILEAEGAEVAVVPLHDFRRTRGIDGRGVRMEAATEDGWSRFWLIVRGSPDGAGSEVAMGLEPPSLTGLAPLVALRAVEAYEAYLKPGKHQWRVRDGGSVIHEADRDHPLGEADGAPKPLVRYLQALATVQRHAAARIRVPDFASEPISAVRSVLAAARLLDGEVLQERINVEVDRQLWETRGPAPLRVERDMYYQVAGRVFSLAVVAEAETVSVVDGADAESGRVRLQPPGGRYSVRKADGLPPDSA